MAGYPFRNARQAEEEERNTQRRFALARVPVVLAAALLLLLTMTVPVFFAEDHTPEPAVALAAAPLE
jgi:hypothetical protein